MSLGHVTLPEFISVLAFSLFGVLYIHILLIYLWTTIRHRGLFQVRVRQPFLLIIDILMNLFLSLSVLMRQVAAEVGFQLPPGYMGAISILCCGPYTLPFFLRSLHLTVRNPTSRNA